jgi:hypothetical protein
MNLSAGAEYRSGVVVVQFDEEIAHTLWDSKGSSSCSQNPATEEVTSYGNNSNLL